MLLNKYLMLFKLLLFYMYTVLVFIFIWKA